MEELRKPGIYGDRLMVMLRKVDKEIQVMDDFILEREDIFSDSEDLANVARIQNRLREVYNDLATDRVRGDSAVYTIKADLMDKEPYQYLITRMVTCGEFQELTAMTVLCDEFA